MSFDGVMLAAVAHELRQWLGAKLERIQQPDDRNLYLQLFSGRDTRLLLICVDPVLSRLHLTETRPKNPPTPPHFCQMLRRQLEGARLAEVRQDGLERVLWLGWQVRDELGNLVTRELVAEIMGRWSNLILLGEDGRIREALQRASAERNSAREIWPGRPYTPPPAAAGKIDPLLQDELVESALQHGDVDGAAPKLILTRVAGLGRELAEEACHRSAIPLDRPASLLATNERAALAAAVRALAQAVAARDFSPTILYRDSQPARFAALALTPRAGEQSTSFASPSALLDIVYQTLARQQAHRTTLERLRQVAATHLERARRKMTRQLEELERAGDAEALRHRGELITAYLHQTPIGAHEIEVPDYAQDGRLVVIPLDPTLSAAQNAQQYFARYQKAKRGILALQKQVAASREEVAYLQAVADTLTRAQAAEPDEADALLGASQEALTQAGYLLPEAPAPKSRSKHPDGAVPAASRPLRFRSDDGWLLFVGRNQRQNDWVTMHLAQPGDWWFHLKDAPGAHVVAKVPDGWPLGQSLPQRTAQQAAQLAAYYSRGRSGSQVPVDYTLRKYVRKPRGAKPGFVIYDHQRTVYVTPEEDLLPRADDPL